MRPLPLSHFALVLLLAAAACKTGPELGGAGDPTVSSQELVLVEQGLTDFTVRLKGTVTCPAPAVLEKASYELVVDGAVQKKGERALNVAVAAGATGDFSLEESAVYVANPDELRAMDQRGGSIPAALRGTLTVKVGDRRTTVEFAKAREVRVPRLPSVTLHELDAGRFSGEEVNVLFSLGVKNPNPFPLRLAGLSYAVQVAGKEVATSQIGRGEKVDPSSTGVFEVPVLLNQESFGPEVAKLIKSKLLPYRISGELESQMYKDTYELKGDIKLNVSK